MSLPLQFRKASLAYQMPPPPARCAVFVSPVPKYILIRLYHCHPYGEPNSAELPYQLSGLRKNCWLGTK
jgi:hypothetical protein